MGQHGDKDNSYFSVLLYRYKNPSICCAGMKNQFRTNKTKAQQIFFSVKDQMGKVSASAKLCDRVSIFILRLEHNKAAVNGIEQIFVARFKYSFS